MKFYSKYRHMRAQTTLPPPFPLTPQVPHIKLIKRKAPKIEDKRLSYYRCQERLRRLNNQPSKPFLPPHSKSKRHKRYRSLLGLEADMTPLEVAAKKLKEIKSEPLAIRKNRRPCSCVQCVLIRRSSSRLPYHCPHPSCTEEFSDYITLFEHQLDEHGEIDAHCRQLVAEMHHQERAVVPYPPSTVYVGEQYLRPCFRPTPWTLLERLDTEYDTLQHKLLENGSLRSAQIIWGLFLAAYMRVQLSGFPELQRQYRVALEYYYSSLKFPVTNRIAYDIDPCPSVAVGRNWLTSSEREDDPLTVEDDDGSDLEIVLIDTRKQQPVNEPDKMPVTDDLPTNVNDKSVRDPKTPPGDHKNGMKDELIDKVDD
ncbi:hypothetical protein BBO99_00000837 [Phytophthora kernoviae]|uniref:C2H2-type domain-containing protein n=2 Tax=Phytophthora kernoviae TaxID=325452 RepID=A0A3R7IP90_9STRA|nr:hypothetical protein G195_001570 [Phytophthora kernoviae 00238/432]KAG2531812.1 hypothetical protein JM16_000662 [Phytophthora kernoviae]KAG2532709.1 hypothetical protein JM18_000744 [Phytophthora kernoviae]RLN44436.1 hypothetical protein BBI17_000983 [Phytophthora kernoviae]RLN85070.1 hypothetical protein BBO99_00000837 [Phytophthora kernoviae]